MVDPVLGALQPNEARRLARRVVEHGDVEVSGHAQEEMANDDLHTTDCVNLIRAGVFEPAEHINGQWRYRITSNRMCVIITFKSATRLRVVTAWRIKR